MAHVEIWTGNSGSGKTCAAVELLRKELSAYGFFSAKYIVPTIGAKRRIEELYFDIDAEKVVLNDPVNIFFTFASELSKYKIAGQKTISDITRHLLLKEIVSHTELKYFEKASGYAGFIDELSAIIDELKIHMIDAEKVQKASEKIKDIDPNYAQKLSELAELYDKYGRLMHEYNVYDREGLMWIAAEILKKNELPNKELKTVIFDGFSRLNPIQLHFIRILAMTVKKVILVFDYNEKFPDKYAPEKQSIDALTAALTNIGIMVYKKDFADKGASKNDLKKLAGNIFTPVSEADDNDGSVEILEAGTANIEVQTIAVKIKELIKNNGYTYSDFAIITRNVQAVHSDYYETFNKYKLPLTIPKIPVSLTKTGKILSVFLRLKLNNWQTGDLFFMLRSGFFDINISDLYIFERKIKRLNLSSLNPSVLNKITLKDETINSFKDELISAIKPLTDILNDLDHRNFSQKINLFLANLVKPKISSQTDIIHYKIIKEIINEANLSGFDIGSNSVKQNIKDLLEIFDTEEADARADDDLEQVQLLNASSLGGQKFKVAFAANLQNNTFPKFTAESPFLMDYERDKEIAEVTGLSIEMRKEYDKDEMSLFTRVINSATEKLFLSYHLFDRDGNETERSDYINEIKRVLPAAFENRLQITASDAVADIKYTCDFNDYLTKLIIKTIDSEHGEYDFAAIAAIEEKLRDFYRYLRSKPQFLSQITETVFTEKYSEKSYSVSELQCYLDCPYRWFFEYAIKSAPVRAEFSHLERGSIMHAALERTFGALKEKYALDLVNIADFDLAEIQKYAEKIITDELKKYPATTGEEEYFYRIEKEELILQIKNFLSQEFERAKNIKLHPKYFEYHFKNVTVGNVKLSGIIDRIDFADNDSDLAVIADYKMNKTHTNKEILNIEKLQAAVYALALSKTMEINIIGSYFLSINKEHSGVMTDTARELYSHDSDFKYISDEEWRELLTECEEKINTIYDNIVDGQIGKTENTKNCRFCDYNNICRNPCDLTLPLSEKAHKSKALPDNLLTKVFARL